ncbi:ribulokinase [Chloroflexia bacterium SDU3-3]|nr:ribulokinase [Chloroflexia bacterium SDU3-3]
MSKYAIGVDFGTESGRAVLVDVADGREVAIAVHPYANSVIDEYLPGTSIRLEPDWALQDPNDYIEVFKHTIPEVLRTSGVAPADVIGLGVDFTSCTMLPTKADGTPLCYLPEWRDTPHAWVKLWKHHAAQDEANRLNQIARDLGYSFLDRYGGKISSEWFFPKVWQILNEAPQVYAAADRILEATDWVVWQLTGVETRNECTAGYKAMWSKTEGFPPDDFFKALDPRMEHVVDEKMSRTLAPLGAKAGGLTAEAAGWTGLLPGTAVAVANVDAHVAVPAAAVREPGYMVSIMGTSNCHMVIGAEEREVPGICGVVQDGILPGFPGFEAGQSCVGDSFAWYVENCVPAAYERQAAELGVSVHQVLERKAAALKPGESGLLALDWWNGNRTILVDADLTGVILGLSLATKPEEIYRALIESTAYGTRIIIDNFEQHGVPIRGIIAVGGLPERNPMLMQIYADVTGRTIRLIGTSQGGAFGSAMYGAVAAGPEAGGYATIYDATERMARLRDTTYTPIPENQKVYEQLYQAFVKLHDYFGRGENDVMKDLKRLREHARTQA